MILTVHYYFGKSEQQVICITMWNAVYRHKNVWVVNLVPCAVWATQNIWDKWRWSEDKKFVLIASTNSAYSGSCVISSESAVPGELFPPSSSSTWLLHLADGYSQSAARRGRWGPEGGAPPRYSEESQSRSSESGPDTPSVSAHTHRNQEIIRTTLTPKTTTTSAVP